jgi:hypothetical protein
LSACAARHRNQLPGDSVVVGIFRTTALPGWEPSARRLVDILIAGSRSTPKRLSTPPRTRQKIAMPGALALKGTDGVIRSDTVALWSLAVLFCISSVISLVISPVRTSDEEADGDRFHVPLSPQQLRFECIGCCSVLRLAARVGYGVVGITLPSTARCHHQPALP